MTRFPYRLVPRFLMKHPVRSALTVLSIAVALFLLCVLRSVVVSLDAAVTQASTNRFVVQSAVSLFVSLPESYKAKIRGVEGVKSTCDWSWFGAYYQRPENFFAQFGIDHETFLDVYPEVEIIDGDAEKFRNERQACLVGESLANKYGFAVGDTLPLVGMIYRRTDGDNWTFDIAGIYRSNSSSVDNNTVFFHSDYLLKSLEEGAADGPEGVGTYAVAVEEGHDPVQAMAAIDALFENGPQRVQSTPESEFQAQFVSMLGNVPFLLGSIGTLVLLAVFLAVLNTLLMGAREQAHDVGILKALGFTSKTIFGVLLGQGLLIAIVGGALGVGLALLSSEPMRQTFGMQLPNYRMTPETVLIGITAALLTGLIAGTIPAMRLARANCVDSLRAEA